MQSTYLGLLTLPTEFFTPTPRVCTGWLSYADVITKFYGIDGLVPLSMGMGLR